MAKKKLTPAAEKRRLAQLKKARIQYGKICSDYAQKMTKQGKEFDKKVIAVGKKLAELDPRLGKLISFSKKAMEKTYEAEFAEEIEFDHKELVHEMISAQSLPGIVVDRALAGIDGEDEAAVTA